ncbi:MAG TPA: hypothetical protein VFI30_02720 [Nocardioidaceae bacterium]|nr:hypothetical protein [Nocardioidaceae bacterium]
MTDRWSLTRHTIKQLTATSEPWMSCADCFDRVDTEVDRLLSARAPMPDDFKSHLRTCQACREEARTLLELAAEESGLDPAPPLARFDTELDVHA